MVLFTAFYFLSLRMGTTPKKNQKPSGAALIKLDSLI